MSGRKGTVFISCGQFSEPERALGRRVAELVEELTPFEGYFAENQISLEGLTRSILGKLFDSVGFIAIMHNRGKVQTLNGTLTRASVWIEQEVAIAALMQQVAGRPLYVASYIEEGVALEGVRQHIHLNPVSFRTDEDVLRHLTNVLPRWQSPLYLSASDIKREIESVKLTVYVVFGWHLDFTIRVKNHSRIEVYLRAVTLWYQDKRLCEPVFFDESNVRKIGPNSELPIAFKTSHDAVERLESYDAIERHLPTYAFPERVDIKVEVEFEALGEHSSHVETVPVEIDFNRQIRPISG
jgi:hypothetical protein